MVFHMPVENTSRDHHFQPVGLAGEYVLTSTTPQTLTYERTIDGQPIRFVDSGRPEQRRRTRWYITDDRNNFISSLWRDNSPPEFDDQEYRYSVTATDADRMQIEVLRPVAKRGV